MQPNVQSKRCLEIANKYHKPVVVMEPCKGGTLVNVPDEILTMMKQYHPNASSASWALRFAASQEGIFMVLSGMNSEQQVLDNCATFDNFEPLNDDEYKIITKASKIINDNVAIPCTACEYCTHDCPKKIAIPQYFALYNSIKQISGSFSSQQVYYNNITLNNHGKASDCIKCGLCEKACLQHLPIRKYLEDVKEVFEKQNVFPARK